MLMKLHSLENATHESARKHLWNKNTQTLFEIGDFQSESRKLNEETRLPMISSFIDVLIDLCPIWNSR